MEENPAILYRIWGLDYVVYGPVELPTVVQWIRDGRVLADTWIFSDENASWSRAAELPELKPLIKTRPVSGPRPGNAGATGIRPGTLRRMKIFADMEEAQLESFLRYMEVVQFPQFATIFSKGDHGDAMFLVLEGEVRARVLAGNKESTLSTMSIGECFGEVAVLDEGPRSADVLANTEATLLKISSAALKRLFQEAPALAAPFLMALSRTILGRLRVLTKRYEDSVTFARTSH